MKKLSYLLLLAGVGLALTSCEEKKEYFEMDTLDGIGMVIRSVSVEDGATIKPVDAIYVDYNNLVGINDAKSATVNGNSVKAYVNPDDGRQLILPVDCSWNEEYTVVVPDGLVYRKDNTSVTNGGFDLSFNTFYGMNPANVASSLTNSNATAEAKALYSELLSNYGKVMYSGAMGGVNWETGYTDFIAQNNDGAGYPKIIGFDYLHLPYSPSDWIDYSDISPVKKIWDAGSIPAVTWHWNVPEINNTLYQGEVVMPADWSGNIQLSKDLFANAKVGNVITVNVIDVADGAQGSFKDGASWAGLVDEDGTNYDYFMINGNDEEGNPENNDTFQLVLTQTLLTAVKENGLIVSGHDYTLKHVSIDSYVIHSDNLSFNNYFSPALALIEGTPHHDIIDADIEKLAGYMKLLQDAGIPVLFRPLHEAAGDYEWGAWFWWGADGVDATIQLWKYLRNKLENQYGLNNLIWVWTMQTSSGGQPASESLIRSAYPGDDLVDMVGVDLYPSDPLTDQSEQFNLVNSVVDGKKMVALCEVGNLIDPNAAAESNTLWSYFMNWYDYASEGVFGFNQWNTQSVSLDGNSYSNPWAAVSNNPFVVNSK